MKKIIAVLGFLIVLFILVGCAKPLAGEVIGLDEATEDLEEMPEVFPEVDEEVIKEENILEEPEIMETPRKISPLVCNQKYLVGDEFSVGKSKFRYKSSTPSMVHLVDLSNGLLKDLVAEEKAAFTLEHKEGNFEFVSSTDFSKDNFEIMLRYPCDGKLSCGKSMATGKLFTLGGTKFQYVRSRGYEYYRVEGQMVRIRDTVEGETYIFPVRKTGIFSLIIFGDKYFFEVTSEDIGKDNYGFNLVYPCE